MKPNCEDDFACYDQGMNDDEKPTGRKVGYVRVSDKDQSENLQIDALRAAGCDVIYGDHGVSGAITKRRGLDDVLNCLEGGDGLTFHDSRHEAITRLSRKLDVLALAKMVGHTDIRVLVVYYEEDAEALAQRLD